MCPPPGPPDRARVRGRGRGGRHAGQLPPAINCQTCDQLEARGGLAGMIWGAVHHRGYYRTVAEVGGALTATLAAAAAGGRDAMYEAHREAWVKTGNGRELARMLNHPLPEQRDYRRRPRPRRRRVPWRMVFLWAGTITAWAVLAAGLAWMAGAL